LESGSGLRLGLGVCRHGLHLQHAEGTARRAALPRELRARLRQGTLRLWGVRVRLRARARARARVRVRVSLASLAPPPGLRRAAPKGLQPLTAPAGGGGGVIRR
jgi:hypothetical protein